MTRLAALTLAAIGPVLAIWYVSIKADSRACTLSEWAVIAWAMLVLVEEVVR